MKKIFLALPTLLLVFATTFLVYLALNSSLEYFLAQCPSKDVLQWDANIRMINVLDQYQDIRNGHYLRALGFFFEGSTWPPLRSIISLIIFFITPAGPDTIQDTLISFVFFCFLFISIFFIAWHLTGSFWSGSLVFFISSIFILHTGEIQAYSLSCMLETQGMFFLLLSVYSIYQLYNNRNLSHEKHYSKHGYSNIIQNSILAFSIVGLFLTKYPFGVMLTLSFVLCEIIRDSRKYLGFAALLISKHYRGLRRVLLAIIFVAFILLLAAGNLAFGGFNQKSFKYIIYYFSLFLFIDFNFYAYKSRFEIRQIIPTSMQKFYVFGAFPGLTWIFLHPDRFSSIIGGHFWIIKQTNSFIKSFVWDIFDSSIGVIALCFFAITAFLIFAIKTRQTIPAKFNNTAHKIQVLLHPLTGITLIIVLQLLLQELFSPNKQYRHIYYLIPSLLTLCGLWIVRTRYLFTGINRRIIAGISAIAILLTGLYVVCQPEGLLSSHYLDKRHICYTGTDKARFREARWVADQVTSGKKYVAINLFHNLPLDAGSKNQATEIDLLLRIKNLYTGSYKNDSKYRWKDWQEFDTLLLITETCNDSSSLEYAFKRAQEANSKIILFRTVSNQEKSHCIHEFTIKKIIQNSKEYK